MKAKLTTVLTVIGAVVLAGCGAGDLDEASGDGGEGRGQALRIAFNQDASSLDPAQGNAGTDHLILYSFFDTLVSFDPETMEPLPGLAESWDISDPMKLVLTLREGVKFHDGSDLTAEVVKTNLDRSRGEGTNIAAELTTIDSIETPDELTVEINLTEPDSSLLLILADRAGMMVSGEQIESDEDSIATAPIGTGAWAFDEWSRGASITGTAHSEYWDTSVDIAPEITYRILTDPKTRADALSSGQVDLAHSIAPADAAGLEANSNLTVSADPTLRVRNIYLDTSSEWFSDPELREAINLAIDRESLTESVYFGYADPASAWLPESHWASVEGEVQYEYDPDAAREIIEEKGKIGEELNMLLPNDAPTVRLGEIIRSNLNEAGIEVSLQPRELVQSTNEFFDDLQHPALMSHWTGRPDPGQTYKQLLSADGYYNPGSGDTPGFEEAVADANETYDQEERAKHFKEAGRATFENSTMVPLAYEHLIVAYNSDVSGYTPNLLGKPKYAGITVGQ